MTASPGGQLSPSRPRRSGRPSIGERLAALDWQRIETSLWQQGYARTGSVLRADECRRLIALDGEPSRFRSTVDMERFRFGVGRYRYFAEPLPTTVAELRLHAYPPLAPIANRWMEALDDHRRYPATLEGLRRECFEQGQTQPTPLLLHYEPGGYNRLHQDLYGAIAFPFQVVIPLCRVGTDFSGGELLLVEQHPRAQSVGRAVSPGRGEMVIFTTRLRPVEGRNGHFRVQVRHGVSPVQSGRRWTLGIIFHDAA